MPDHVHLLLSIPLKFSVANTIGVIKGKSAIRIHRDLLKSKRMTGLSFWARGYCVSTVGFDEEVITKPLEGASSCLLLCRRLVILISGYMSTLNIRIHIPPDF